MGTIHKSDVVVTGDFALTGSQSVALPTHKPLLALRDPPGGLSYAYYENMVSTIRVEMEDYEHFVGIDAGVKASFGGASDLNQCTGMGAKLCMEAIEIKPRHNSMSKVLPTSKCLCLTREVQELSPRPGAIGPAEMSGQPARTLTRF